MPERVKIDLDDLTQQAEHKAISAVGTASALFLIVQVTWWTLIAAWCVFWWTLTAIAWVVYAMVWATCTLCRVISNRFHGLPWSNDVVAFHTHEPIAPLMGRKYKTLEPVTPFTMGPPPPKLSEEEKYKQAMSQRLILEYSEPSTPPTSAAHPPGSEDELV